MSETLKAAHELDKRATLMGISGLVALVIGLTFHLPFVGLLGVIMTTIGVKGEERFTRGYLRDGADLVRRDLPRAVQSDHRRRDDPDTSKA